MEIILTGGFFCLPLYLLIGLPLLALAIKIDYEYAHIIFIVIFLAIIIPISIWFMNKPFGDQLGIVLIVWGLLVAGVVIFGLLAIFFGILLD